jgi:hypothetical protein
LKAFVRRLSLLLKISPISRKPHRKHISVFSHTRVFRLFIPPVYSGYSAYVLRPFSLTLCLTDDEAGKRQPPRIQSAIQPAKQYSRIQYWIAEV